MVGPTVTAASKAQRDVVDVPSIATSIEGASVGPFPEIGATWTPAAWPWRGLTVALAAHGAILAALLWLPPRDAGGGGVALEAIEVSVTNGQALDALIAAARTDADAAPSRIAEPPAPASEAQQREKPEPDRANEKPQETATLTVPQSDFQLPTRAPEISVEASETGESSAKVTIAPQSPSSGGAGGVTSRGSDAAASAEPAGTRAPPGVIQDYARSVAKVLARNKPNAPGPKGTARVRFTVAGDGRVANASVIASSGHGVLDAAALAAVLRSQFPAPPVTLSQIDTTFDLPFHFR